jgi:dihydroorotase/N-acyl-D-amino-acid deacylase
MRLILPLSLLVSLTIPALVVGFSAAATTAEATAAEATAAAAASVTAAEAAAAEVTGAEAALQTPDTVPADTLDILIRGGRVVDGTGNPWRFADVGVLGDRIVAIRSPGRLDATPHRQVIDLDGKVLAPGFIDMNGQSDLLYLEDGGALSKIFQGVTTEIMGESTTPAPLNRNINGAVSPADTTAVRRAREWVRFGAWLEEMEVRGVAVNVGSFLGGTTVRRWAMGLAEGQPTEAQLDSMRAVTRRSMQDGAFGVATALIYAPGAFAGTDELVEIAREVSAHGGIYITHMRSESYHILEALEEAIEIGERSGAPIELYHLKLAGVDNWGLTDAVLDRIEAARARGQDIRAGIYPYTAASTGLTSCFPPWVQADGRLYRNLASPEQRNRIRAELLGPPTAWENWCRLATPEGSIVASVSNPDHVRFVGRSLADVARIRGVDWVDAAMDLVLADRSRVGMIYFAMDEANVRRKMALPWISFGTDAAGWNPRGAGGQPHPRAYGTYPRILGTYVRDEGVLTLEEAVRKSSWAVAQRLGIPDRGLVTEGFFADLVAFDPETIRENSTYTRPHQLATGVHWVWVNGTPVIAEGRATGARPGRFLRGPGAAIRFAQEP